MSLAEYDREKLENILMTIDINEYPHLIREYIELHNDILDYQESILRVTSEWFDKKNEMEALQNKTKNMNI